MHVVVIGGGAIGCASAWSLARAGARVTLVDRGSIGGEASAAAAGILGAQIDVEADTPLFRLGLASRAMYPKLLEELRDASGIDVEHRACGVLRVGSTDEELEAIERNVGWQIGAGLDAVRVDGKRAREIEPRLANVAGGVFFEADSRIDPPRLLASLKIACERAGVAMVNAAAAGVTRREDRARVVVLEDASRIEADAVLVAAGSWSTTLSGVGLPLDAVKPARGQILELFVDKPLRTVIDGARVYFSPRDDGRLLVGSTVELAGFAPFVTASAARDLLTEAIRLVPDLEGARFSRAWAGLRPRADDELPLIGCSPVGGLYIATGHFRNGILLAPITAKIVTALLTGTTPDVDLAPYDPLRLVGPLGKQ